VPQDPQSLAQMYQRWDYQDYIALWHSLSAAEKRQWETDARPYKITGFNYWMRTRLNALTNLVGRWHLDRYPGTSVPDSSKNDNPGTLFGPTYTEARIAQGIGCDGVDDHMKVNHHSSLNLGTTGTIMAFFKPLTGIGTRGLIANKGSNWGRAGWTVSTFDTNKIWFFWSGLVEMSLNSVNTYTLDEFHHVACRMNGATMNIFIDGIKDPANRANTQSSDNPYPIYSGYEATKLAFPFKGVIDELVLVDIALPDEDIKRHSLRRYPL